MAGHSAQQVAALVAGGLPDGFTYTDRLTPEFAKGIVARARTPTVGTGTASAGGGVG